MLNIEKDLTSQHNGQLRYYHLTTKILKYCLPYLEKFLLLQKQRRHDPTIGHKLDLANFKLNQVYNRLIPELATPEFRKFRRTVVVSNDTWFLAIGPLEMPNDIEAAEDRDGDPIIALITDPVIVEEILTQATNDEHEVLDQSHYLTWQLIYEQLPSEYRERPLSYVLSCDGSTLIITARQTAMTYYEDYIACGLTFGDKILVVRPPTQEEIVKWNERWTSWHNHFIGCIATILIASRSGFTLAEDQRESLFPCYSLQKIEPATCTFHEVAEDLIPTTL